MPLRRSSTRSCFSALQRAENSSIFFGIASPVLGFVVSVLFSEPKIPQLSRRRRWATISRVSVLFSEPKIPQSASSSLRHSRILVSVLFSEPKIPQSSTPPDVSLRAQYVSVLFSEPKIPQLYISNSLSSHSSGFSALQRAENSSIALAFRRVQRSR